MPHDFETTLLVAATGGPLAELHALASRVAVDVGAVEWATFRSPQTRELLGDQVVHHLEPVVARDLRGARANLPIARHLIEERGITRVISTGSAVALPFVIAARERGLPVHYVESAARVAGPSLTGALVARIPGVRLYAQHAWGGRRWAQHGSVFDGLLSVAAQPAQRIERVVVTLGSQPGYGFRRAVERLIEVLPTLASRPPTVLWQTGGTDTFGLGIESRAHVPMPELAQAIAEAELVVSHAGVGSALTALRHGQVPVLLPRRQAHGEHSDDHQVELARALDARGLGVHLEVEDLTRSALVRATGHATVGSRPPLFELQDEPRLPRRARRHHSRVADAGVPGRRTPEPVEPAAARPAPVRATATLAAPRIAIPQQRTGGRHLRSVEHEDAARG